MSPECLDIDTNGEEEKKPHKGYILLTDEQVDDFDRHSAGPLADVEDISLAPSQEAEPTAEEPLGLNTYQNRERMKNAIVRAHDNVSRTEPPSHEAAKSAGERHADWVDAKMLEVIEDQLGSRIDQLVKALKRSGRLDDENPDLQKFRIAKSDKNAALFDLLEREDFLKAEGEGDDKTNYLDPAGYIAAKLLIDPSLPDSDKYLLIGGGRRLAGVVIAGKIQQAKLRSMAK